MTVIAKQFLASLSQHSPPPELLPGGDPNCHRRRPTSPRPDNPRRLPREGLRGVPARPGAAGHRAEAVKGAGSGVPPARAGEPSHSAGRPCRCFSSEQENQLHRRDRRRGGSAAYWACRAGDGEPSRDALCQRSPGVTSLPGQLSPAEPSQAERRCREGIRTTGSGGAGRGSQTVTAPRGRARPPSPIPACPLLLRPCPTRLPPPSDPCRPRRACLAPSRPRPSGCSGPGTPPPPAPRRAPGQTGPPRPAGTTPARAPQPR